MKSVIIGYYEVPGFGPDSVETAVVGRPAEQYATLKKLIEARHPGKKNIVRTGSNVELRTKENAFIELADGATIDQLFSNEKTGEAETNREIGKVFMSSRPYNVFLVHLRAQGYVQVQLTPKLRSEGDAVFRFSNRLNPNRLVTELPQIIKDVIGADARNLVLNFREAKPKKSIA
jgi:hypothetical protein